MKRYLIYHLRWQLATVVMMPVMYLLKDYPYAVGLIGAKLWGALIMYKVDAKIFDGKGSMFIYTLRWQLAGLCMIPLMYVIGMMKVPLWLNLALAQFVAAIFFWYLDSWIFRKNKNKEAVIQLLEKEESRA